MHQNRVKNLPLLPVRFSQFRFRENVLDRMALRLLCRFSAGRSSTMELILEEIIDYSIKFDENFHDRKKLVKRLEGTKNYLQYQGKRSAGTFPTGLPDGEIMIEIHQKRVDTNVINPSGTFPPIYDQG